jgi:alkyl hydroperoxide reductase subunit AhpC
MSRNIGQIAPDFEGESTQGKINFYDWSGDSWVLFLSHPKDYTPVCTTELGEIAKLIPNFEVRDTKVLAISIDDVAAHQKWIKEINASQNCEVSFPILGDPKGEISQLYEMIYPDVKSSNTVRTVFFISPEKKIEATINYPESTGRNMSEILRVLDSLQLSKEYDVATPANWNQNKDVVIPPDVPLKDLQKKYPKGYKEIYPYLRITPQPDK